MVKLRSRLIRSPFSGGAGPSASGEGSSSESGSNSNGQQQQGRSNSARSSRRGNDNRHPSWRMERNDSERPAGGVAAAAERRPLETVEPRPSSVASPGKRKPESRGITASIRRAKTAMFRIASSPRMSSSQMGSRSASHNSLSSRHASGESEHGGTVGATGRNELGAVVAPTAHANGPDMDANMDNAGSGNEIPEGSYSTPTGAAASGAGCESLLALVRTPSQEENFPPMAQLSPNCRTYCAHSAAAAHLHFNGGGNAGRGNYGNGGDGRGGSGSVNLDLKPAARPTPANAVTPPAPKNVLEWMRDDAPPELLPRLLSFLGSRRVRALSRTCQRWNETSKDESVWRVLCEDTRKWKDGDDVPDSWAQFYKQNPVVPIDYDTVDAAFEAISSGRRHETVENNVRHRHREQRHTCRILLHPGPYFLRRPLVANVIGEAELTIEAVVGVRDPEHGMTWRQNYHDDGRLEEPPESVAGAAPATPPRRRSLLPGDYLGTRTARRPSSPTLRQIFGSCGPRLSSSMMGGVLDTSRRSSASSRGRNGGGDDDNDNDDDSLVFTTDQSANRAAFHQSCFSGRPTPLLCLESRRENEPAVRVRQGRVTLRGISILHYCEGTDIWNGNAAVQVQRAFGRNGRPLRVDPPSYVAPAADVVDCEITSLSGRGLVVIDGATSDIADCNITGSAATGVYVGGAGSVARMERTDVVDNGVGNARVTPGGRGVARGHSGVYVEQGLARILDSNVSGNTLTGISAISTEHARLHIEGSDVNNNRSDQVEMPPDDTGRGISRNNDFSRTGPGRARSARLRERIAAEEAAACATPRGPRRRRTGPASPQSPLDLDVEV